MHLTETHFTIMCIVLYAAATNQTEVPKPKSDKLSGTGIILDVKTTSDQLDVTWYNREGSWADVTNFTVIINEDPQASKFCASDVYCISSQCSFNSKEFCTAFDSCSRVIVTLLGQLHDIELEYSEYAIMAPLAPSEVDVQLAGLNIDITWILPSTCELGSLLIGKVSEDFKADYLLAPTDYYHYRYADQTVSCEIGEVLLKTVGEYGESYGISYKFLITEISTLNIDQLSENEIIIQWLRPDCVEKMYVAWYEGGTHSSSNFIAEDETTSLIGYTITGLQDYDRVLVCVTPLAKGSNDQWAEGEEVCSEPKDYSTTSTNFSTMTTSTTTEIIESTTKSLGLSCYSCFDCPTTSAASTAVTQDPDYTTCFTSFVTSEVGSYVVRGGERTPRQDGECDQTDTTLSCYCGHDLCNASPGFNEQLHK